MTRSAVCVPCSSARGWADDVFFAGLAQDADRLVAETRRVCLSKCPHAPLDEVFRTTLCREAPLLKSERRAADDFRGPWHDHLAHRRLDGAAGRIHRDDPSVRR